MHRPAARLAVLVLLAAAAPAIAQPKDDFFFKKGDRIVWLGDSITEQYQYSSYLELYLTTRFPDWKLTFINAGIGGDNAGGGANRFAKQVLAEKPTCVTIDFGMNDGGYGGFDDAKAANFVKQTEAMVKAAKEAGVGVVLISPNAVEVRSNPGLKTYLETQQKFYAPLKEIAEKNGLPFVDQYAVTRKILEKMEADKAEPHAFPDGVHTGPAGGLLMAHTILTGLHAPAAVSDLEIDAAAVKAGKATRCAAAKIEGGANGVSFDRTDEALPLPVQKDWRGLLPYVNDLKDLNYYGLTVKGLTDGQYTLRIDGKEVGTYPAKDLAAGVNLGNLDAGPHFEQGQKLLDAIKKKNDELVHPRFNEVMRFQAPAWLELAPESVEEKRVSELKRRMDLIEARQAEVYKLAQPTAHRFELKAAK
jgi:lysophospholipase L1-like esterase